jgi:hypothetical protein
MTSVSGPQHRYMEMKAHQAGNSKMKTVAQEFVKADEAAGKHFKMSGKGALHAEALRNHAMRR